MLFLPEFHSHQLMANLQRKMRMVSCYLILISLNFLYIFHFRIEFYTIETEVNSRFFEHVVLTGPPGRNLGLKDRAS